MAPTRKINVAIIGGGIGGACTALALLRHVHLDVTIYESAPVFSEIGAGLGLAPNAQTAMRLIGPETAQVLHKVATYPMRPEHRRVFFEYTFGQGPHASEHIANVENESGFVSCHRARLLDELVALLPQGLTHFGKRLVGIDDSSPIITLAFADGSTATADCVVGADGVHSATRPFILGPSHPAVQPRFSGFVGYRAVVPMDVAARALGATKAATGRMILGEHGMINSYPIEQGKLVSIVLADASIPSWDGPWSRKADMAYVREKFKDWDADSKALVELVDKPETMAWALFELPESDTFVRGNVVMLGDAAHATTPFQGQGANQAMEDAYILGEVLGEAKSLEDVPAALAAFDQVRRPRAFAVTASSKECGNLIALQLEGIGGDPRKIRENLESRYQWMWYHDLEKDAKVAQSIFWASQSAGSAERSIL